MFGADDFDEVYIEEATNRGPKLGKKKRRQEKHKRSDSNKDEVIGAAFDRPLFSTHHGVRQSKKKNVAPLEVVVPYSRARKERFYFWPPYSLLACDPISQDVNKDDYPDVVKKSQ